MKKLLFVLFILPSISSTAQQVTMEDLEVMYNGIKDGKETQVDCIGSYCKGNSCMTFNGKNYCTGAILSNSTNDQLYASENKNLNHLSLSFTFYRGNVLDNIAISFFPIDHFKMEPKKVKLKVVGEEVNQILKMKSLAPSFLITTMSGQNINILKLREFKKKTNEGAYIEIINVNNIERLISGKFEIIGETIDGTPVDIKGTFENVTY
jgi:hypothetical protein